jgi:hypothetical protein
MADYPQLTIDDVATYSGRDKNLFSDFMDEALLQATLLFKLGTCLPPDQFPDDPTKAELARYGILAMANAIELAQPYQAILSNPFNNETIGSYSYSKLTSAVTNSLPTGITFFDMATGLLSVCDIEVSELDSGGIYIFNSGNAVLSTNRLGYSEYLSPVEVQNLLSLIGHDPSGGFRA